MSRSIGSRWSVVLRGGLVSAVAAGALAVMPSAQAASFLVGTMPELQTALANCSAPPNTVVLTANVVDASAQLTVACAVTIELDSHNLTVRNVVINPGETLEVTDTTATPGTLTADASAVDARAGIRNTGATLITSGTAQVAAAGGRGGAGIGGDGDLFGGGGDAGTTITNDSSTINATGGTGADSGAGGSGGAGIGGGASTFGSAGDGGTTTTNDSSTITATGGTGFRASTASGGAGIGGGGTIFSSGGAGGTTTNDSSTITATGGGSTNGGGAGIGGGGSLTAVGGAGGGPGVTSILGASMITATAGGGSAVGVGKGGPAGPGVFLSVATGATLRLGSDLVVTDADADPATHEVRIEAGGLIARRISPASTAAITGSGTIDNAGAITLPTVSVGAKVKDRHYQVSFDTQGGSLAPAPVTVYADTFAHGDRTFPADPTKAGYVFTGWNTAANGSGTTVTATTALTGSSTDGTAFPTTLYAQWLDPAGNLNDLKTVLASCTGSLPTPYTVALSANLTGTSTQLTVNCDATIDLNGHDLTVRNVVIDTGKTLEVTDTTVTPGTLTANASAVGGTAGIRNTGATLTTSGTAKVVAKGGLLAAGIGGGGGITAGSGGTTTSNGTSSITATGGDLAAGIGGGGGPTSGAGGTTTSNDSSSITATGGDSSAGIGGGYGNSGGVGGTTTSTGTSTITATGGDGGNPLDGGAGIGGAASNGGGGSTTIEGGSTIIATATDGGSAIGIGAGATPSAGTFLTVTDGTLKLGGDLVVPDTAGSPEVSVGANGVIMRSSPAGTAKITGSGTIDNAGAITLPTAAVAPTLVKARHYAVSFDTQGGSPAPAAETVYADTFTHGDRTFPADPTKAGYVFTGWNTAANGSGTTVTATTALTGSSTDGTAFPITLHAQWADPTSDLAALKAALNTCTDTLPTPYTVALSADLVDTAAELTVNCDAVINLNGHDLTVRNIVDNWSLEVTDTTPVAPGADPNADAGTLTADASAVNDTAGIQTTYGTVLTTGTAQVIATGGDSAAGIGGDSGFDGGRLESHDSSTITATGGVDGAGIGGGRAGDGGSTTTYDTSSITATGGQVGAGAGIGGGEDGDGGTTTSNDASSITADSGRLGAAGIGGGHSGGGGTTTSNDTSTITAEGSPETPAIGAGRRNNDPGYTSVNGGSTMVVAAGEAGSVIGFSDDYGTPVPGTFLSVTNGTLRLGYVGHLRVPDADADPATAEVSVGAGGVITREAGSLSVITGSGTVANGGAITLPTGAVAPTLVKDRHYRVSFDAQGGAPAPADVTVYADTFAHGDRTLPAASRPGYLFEGWATAPSGGTPVTVTTVLPGTSADGLAAPVTLYAQWRYLTPDIAGLQPTITGTAQVGHTLHADPGPLWPPNADLTYTWNADSTPIPDTDHPDLPLTAALEGATITVTIHATAPGYLPATATSDPVGPVAPADPDTVTSLDPPVVTGHRWYDADLTTTTGTWTGDPTTFTYQWLRDGNPIPDATDPAYRTTQADIGHPLAVQVTAQSATSSATVTVDAGTITPAPMVWASSKKLTIKVKGKPTPGKKLRASLSKKTLKAGTDPDATHLTYQWLRDGTPIKKATKPTYQAKNKDKGHRITLTVTLTKPGYTPLTLKTKAIRIKR